MLDSERVTVYSDITRFWDYFGKAHNPPGTSIMPACRARAGSVRKV